MSKQNRKDLAISAVHPFHADENISRSGDLFKNDEDRAALARELYGGWKVQLGDIGVYALSDEQKKAAHDERVARYEELKSEKDDIKVKVDDATITVTASERLRVWEDTFCKSNKVIVPTHGVVYAFRRTESLPLVNALRFKNNESILDTVPVTVYEFDNELDRMVTCITENTGKTAGARSLSDKDNVKAAVNMFMTRCREADFRRVWKVGTAQKLFALCKLDAKHPDAKLIENVLTDKLSFGPLDKEKMRKIVNDDASTLESVQAMLAEPRGNKPKIANRTDIETATTQHPTVLVAWTVKQVLNNTMANIDRLVPAKDDLNEAINAVLAKHNITID